MKSLQIGILTLISLNASVWAEVGEQPKKQPCLASPEGELCQLCLNMTENKPSERETYCGLRQGDMVPWKDENNPSRLEECLVSVEERFGEPKKSSVEGNSSLLKLWTTLPLCAKPDSRLIATFECVDQEVDELVQGFSDLDRKGYLTNFTPELVCSASEEEFQKDREHAIDLKRRLAELDDSADRNRECYQRFSDWLAVLATTCQTESTGEQDKVMCEKIFPLMISNSEKTVGVLAERTKGVAKDLGELSKTQDRIEFATRIVEDVRQTLCGGPDEQSE